MKKEFLFLLLAAFVLIFASCNQVSKSSSSGDVSGGIVYVNSDTLLAKWSYSIDQNKQFKATADSLQNVFQQREASFQAGVSNYQKNGPNMSENQRKQTEGMLGQQQQELQQMQQAFQQQASEKQLDLTKALSKKLQDFLKDYSVTHHYKMVMIYSALNSGILYGDPSLDITKDLIKDLNDTYSKDKK